MRDLTVAARKLTKRFGRSLALPPAFLYRSVFLGLTTLPGWVKTVAHVLPGTRAEETSRSLMRRDVLAGSQGPVLWLIPPTGVVFLVAARLVRRRIVR